MVQALQKRYPTTTSESSSTSAESVGVPLDSFSVDNELLTSENIVVPTHQMNNVAPQKRWTQRETSGSYTSIAGQVITFPGLSDSAIGITEGDIEDEIRYDFHYRDILIKTARRVIFTKEISLAPGPMRRLQPKIILDERYLSRDDD